MLFSLLAPAARAGETRCWLEHGAIVVPARFGPAVGEFVLDAATPVSQLSDTVADMWNLGRPAEAELALAGERLPGFAMRVTDIRDLARAHPAGIAGVIGADALAGFVTEIETQPCRVRLTRRAGRPWPIRLPLRLTVGGYATPAVISDGATSRSGWFAVATGAPGVTVADATLTREPPKDADPDWPPARLRALSLAGVLMFENLPAGVTDQAPAGLAGAIGEAAWRRYRLRLDPARGRLELAPVRPSLRP